MRDLLSALAILSAFSGSSSAWGQVRQPSGPALTAFRSERELTDYLIRLSRERARRQPASCAHAASKARALKVPSKELVEASGGHSAVIQGTVSSTSGEPLRGAIVVVGSLAPQPTSADGTYRIRLPADSLGKGRTFTIVARAIGFQQRPHQVQVKQGGLVDVSFTLCPAAFHLEEVVVAAQAAADESITNTQHEGVDEGGIVKLHGDHLVILRRGRLFTVSVASGRLDPVSVVDAFAPDIDPRYDWYDEVLISGNTIVVVGYSYQRRATELGLFRIDPDGRLTYLSTWHLRSNDYYSSRNFASRLVAGRLVIYTPLELAADLENPMKALPAIRKWQGDESGEFRRIGGWQRVYRPAGPFTPLTDFALHTVTSCDLSREELACDATVVIGPPGRVFYVSPRAVYVWTTGRRGSGEREALSTLYRIPVGTQQPSGMQVSGSPVDQFSFLEDEAGFLNVLVRSKAGGDAMWSAERAAGRVGLLRFTVGSFNRTTRAPGRWYRALPAPEPGAFQNRFVGNHLLYGTGNDWWAPRAKGSELFVVPFRGGPVERLGLAHAVDRIEVLGGDAVVIGTDSTDLHFRAVRLGDRPAPGHGFIRAGASQGELRSHGFFYRADGPDSGVLGLPVRGAGRPGYEHLFEESTSLLFLRNDGRSFTALGELRSDVHTVVDDRCRASCVDWYGNARPLFFRGRMLALLGYELVEGVLMQDGIREVRRVSFAPGS